MRSHILKVTMLGFLSLGFFLSCGKSSSSSTPSSNLTSTTASNISKVESGMLPDSLKSSSSTLSLADGGPCKDTNGFFDCQPILLKLYLAVAKLVVSQTRSIIETVGGQMTGISFPSSGTLTLSGIDGVKTIDYTATSATEYSVLVHSATDPFLYLYVKDDAYTIKMNLAKGPKEEDDDGTGPQTFEATIKFTNDSNFTVDLKLLEFICSDDDVRAPGAMAINLLVADGVWQGKAMMYLPRWLAADGTKCTFEPTSTSKMFIYTNFVGDNTNSTLSLYMMPITVTSSSDFSTYPASSFCTNFASSCQNGQGFGDAKPLSFYVSPACASSGTSWGSACTSSNTKISTPTYSEDALWIMPETLSGASTTIPSSIK